MPTETVEDGTNCTQKTCDGEFHEEEEGKFVCGSCGHTFGKQSY